jgi:hypothetical protein
MDKAIGCMFTVFTGILTLICSIKILVYLIKSMISFLLNL